MKGNLIDVNNAACDTLGYEREELLQLTLGDIERAASHDEFVGSWDRLRNGSIITTEGEHQRKDGERFPVEVRVAIVESEQQPFVFALARDITHRKEIETRRRQHDAELAHLARVSTIGQMTAELAHEINQPLYAIGNFAEACQTIIGDDPDIPERLRTWTRKIEEQANRAGDIVRRVTRFVSEVDPQHVDFHINDTVRDVAQLIDFDVAAHHVRLEFDFDEGLPAVHGEQISLEQVLVNLMRNGFHAMKNVPTADRLMTVSTARDGNFIQVAVRDSGVGFQGKSLDELIQPFVTNKIDGVGLGLAICRNTIQLAGGRFWAQENDQPPGVTFLFTYPVSPRVDSSLGEATST